MMKRSKRVLIYQHRPTIHLRSRCDSVSEEEGVSPWIPTTRCVELGKHAAHVVNRQLVNKPWLSRFLSLRALFSFLVVIYSGMTFTEQTPPNCSWTTPNRVESHKRGASKSIFEIFLSRLPFRLFLTWHTIMPCGIVKLQTLLNPGPEVPRCKIAGTVSPKNGFQPCIGVSVER